jgi:gentisate 1,2-dioxygenase
MQDQQLLLKQQFVQLTMMKTMEFQLQQQHLQKEFTTIPSLVTIHMERLMEPVLWHHQREHITTTCLQKIHM